MTATVEQHIRRNACPNRNAGSVQLVGFRLANEEYGIEITKVREIILPTATTRLPQSPDYILGVIHLRNEVIPVVDLRRRFGLPEQEATEETRIVVVHVGGKTLGLLVDSVSEVLRAAHDQIVPPPAVVVAGREYLTGLLKWNNRLLILLDIERLFGAETESASEKEGLGIRD